jgi:hypothetical protein
MPEPKAEDLDGIALLHGCLMLGRVIAGPGLAMVR